MKSFIENANAIYTSEFSSLTSRKYWVGLHMESSAGGTSEFHWGNCVPHPGVTNSFDSLTNYGGATACGYVSLDSLSLTACSTSVSLGFICENPSGKDSCFTKMPTTMYSLGYDSKTALTSSNCALECLTSSSCGAVYVTAGSSCSMLQYNTDLSSSLSATHLSSTQLYHRRFLYHDQYSLSFKAGLTEDELCNEPIGSPITTTAIGDVTTTVKINPTTTKQITTQPITEKTTTDDVTTNKNEEPSTAQTSDATTNEDVTIPTNKVTTDDVTTQKTTETPTNDVTTQPTTETANDDVTTISIDGLSTTTQISASNSSLCYCTCSKRNITTKVKIEERVSELKLDISVLSSTVRTKGCAEDTRPSARNVGILGILIITVTIGFIISMDCIRLFKYINRQKVRIKQPVDPDKRT